MTSSENRNDKYVGLHIHVVNIAELFRNMLLNNGARLHVIHVILSTERRAVMHRSLQTPVVSRKSATGGHAPVFTDTMQL